MITIATPAAERDTALLLPNPAPKPPNNNPVVQAREEAEKRYHHAEKAEKRRVRCCRFFCFFGVFFGIVFLLMAPVSWWQTLVCVPPPSMWEDSLVGITATGRSQTYYITQPDEGRLWLGDSPISLPAENAFNGVGTYDAAHQLYFWALPGAIHVFSRDGARKADAIDIPERLLSKNATFQCIKVEPTHGSEFILYAITPAGEVYSYQSSQGWGESPLVVVKEKLHEIAWNFIALNSKDRTLYFAGIRGGKTLLFQLDLNTLKYTTTSAPYELSKSIYDTEADTFVWLYTPMEPLNFQVRTYDPKFRQTVTDSFDFETDKLAEVILDSHKWTYDPEEKRFFLVDPYHLTMYVFDSEGIDSFKTRLAYPVSLEFAPGFTF